MTQGLVASIHDISDGGLGVALAESSFSGGIGAKVSLAKLGYEGVARDDFALFSETPCRFLISVSPLNSKVFEETLEGFPLSLIGETSSDLNLTVEGLTGKTVIDMNIWELKKAWQAPGL